MELPEKMQDLDGRSLLPLLDNPDAKWPDRELFFHCGRWNPGKREKAVYEKCAVRTERWRFVNNEYLFDIDADPSESEDVAASYPEVVSRLQESYQAWWDSTLPFLVNEGLPKLKPKSQPFSIRYREQLEKDGIPDWAPNEF